MIKRLKPTFKNPKKIEILFHQYEAAQGGADWTKDVVAIPHCDAMSPSQTAPAISFFYDKDIS